MPPPLLLWAIVVGSILGPVDLEVLEDFVQGLRNGNLLGHIKLRVRSWSWARIRAVAIRSSMTVSDNLESMVSVSDRVASISGSIQCGPSEAGTARQGPPSDGRVSCLLTHKTESLPQLPFAVFSHPSWFSLGRFNPQ